MASEFVGRIGFFHDLLGFRSGLPTLRFKLSKTHGCKAQVACSTTTQLTMNLRCHPSITKQISPQILGGLRRNLLIDNLKPERGE